MITETIGARIKELREKFKLSQQDLAKQLNTARPVISNWEHGKTEPSSSQLKKLATIFETSADYILGADMQTVNIIVVDTSALIKRPSFISELIEKFDEVIIPDIVISELNNLKDNGKPNIKQKAWLAMSSINNEKNLTHSKIIISKNTKVNGNNDEKIADIAIRKAKLQPYSNIYLLSDDIFFNFLVSNIKNITPITPKEYLLTFHKNEQDYDLVKSIEFFHLVKSNNLEKLKKIDLTKVDVNLHDPESGLTPLIVAVRNRNQEIIKFLLDLPNIHIDKHDKFKYGFSAIHHATQLKDLSIIQLFTENNADIDLGSYGKNAGNTPLMISAWSGFKEGVDFFIQQGACVNQQDSNGFTPLIKACIKNDEAIISKLIHITDKNIRSKENKRAIDYLDPKKINIQKVLSLFQESVS